MIRFLLVWVPPLLLAGCGPVAPGPDLTPIEDGMRFLGVSLVVAVLAAVFGLARKGGKP
jgi:hypothetical protein